MTSIEYEFLSHTRFTKTTRQVDQQKIQLLDKLLEAMFNSFPSLIRARRFTCTQAWFFLLFALHKKGGSLHTFLDLFTFRGLVGSIEPSDDVRCARPGMPADPEQRPQPCVVYCDLWKSLQAEDHILWLKRRGYDVDKATATKIASEVYDRFFEAVIRVMSKLDLAVSSEFNAGNEAEHGDQQDQPLPEDENVTHSAPQASCMSGLERPKCCKDMELFLNLVDLCQLFMNGLHAQFFQRSYFPFVKCMIEKSTLYPLMSGFFKLLTASMHLIEQGGFLSGPEPTLHDSMVSSKGETLIAESDLCRIILDKFADEVILRCSQFFQDLLASSLEFILSLPESIRKAQTQIPALRASLKMGISHVRIAEIAFKCLESLVQDNRDHLRPHLPSLLPLLDGYLVLHTDREDYGPVLSVEQRNRRLTAMLKKNNRWEAWGLQSDSKGAKRDLALRAVRLLGNLGPDSNSLCCDVTGEDDVSPIFDARQKVLRVKCGLDHVSSIFMDPALARIVYLAQNTTERQCKVSACELLHALTICAVGEHSHCPGHGDDKRSSELKKFDDLFRFLMPCIFQLAVDTDVIATKLFEPLAFQLVRWFASKAVFKAEAQIVLDAVLKCLESPDDGRLREESSKWLAEYVKWILKGMTTEALQENPDNVKNLLRRLYGLLNHASVCKRLGGYSAMRHLSSALVPLAFQRIVDQFLLEIFHHLILSLRFVSLDDPALDTEKSAVYALAGLEKILLRKTYLDMLNAERQGKGVLNRRRVYATLADFTEFLFKQIASCDRPVRRYCRQLFFRLSSKLNGVSQPADWIQQNARALPEGFDCTLREEFAKSKVNLKIKQLREIIAASDAWEWLISNKLTDPEQLLVKASNLVKGISSIVSDLHHDRSSSIEISGSEKNSYALEKSQCIYAILKLIVSCAEASNDERGVVKSLMIPAWQTLIVCSLLTPKELGLNVFSDPMIATEIPRQAERLFRSMTKYADITLQLRKLVSEFVESSPHIRLSTFNLDSSPLDFYQVLRLFSGYRLLAVEKILDNVDHEAKLLLKSLSETRAANPSPAKKEAAESVLKFSLGVLGANADPLSVWSEIFADIKGTDWRESVSWKFYERFRKCFDEYLAAKFVQSPKQRDIVFRKALKSEFGAVILGNLLEYAIKDYVPSSDSDQAAAETKLRTEKLVTAYIENFDFIEKMIASDEGGHVLRKQQVLEIVGRLAFLVPQLDVDPAAQAAQLSRVSSAYLTVLKYVRSQADSSTTLSVPEFQLFLTALKVLPGFLAHLPFRLYFYEFE